MGPVRSQSQCLLCLILTAYRPTSHLPILCHSESSTGPGTVLRGALPSPSGLAPSRESGRQGARPQRHPRVSSKQLMGRLVRRWLQSNYSPQSAGEVGTRTAVMPTHQGQFQGGGEAALSLLTCTPPIAGLSPSGREEGRGPFSPHLLSTYCVFSHGRDAAGQGSEEEMQPLLLKRDEKGKDAGMY